MVKEVKKHIAIYGSVKVNRCFCEFCKCWTIVAKDGLKLCCNKPSEENPSEYKSMMEAFPKRRTINSNTKKLLLEKFNNSCCYCDRRFGSYVEVNGSLKQIRVNYDHKIPFSYSYNNQDDNFLPACSFCNNWKSNNIFQTMEDAKLYVSQKWEEAKTVTV